jgi:ribokinase
MGIPAAHHCGRCEQNIRRAQRKCTAAANILFYSDSQKKRQALKMAALKAIDVVCIASWNADLTSQVSRPMARGETLIAKSFSISPGGKGSNASIACARQGASTAVIARIGTDSFGEMAMALWSHEGIDASHVEQINGEASGVAQILVYDDGDNSIAVALGAGAGLNEKNIDSAKPTIESCKVVMASLEVPVASTKHAFEIARQAGKLTILNPAPAQILDADLIRLCSVLTPNEIEVRALANLGETAPIKNAVQWLFDRGAAAVIVTLGASGCELWQPFEEPLSLPGWKIQNMGDTVGAGDTFTGALAAALARGLNLKEAAYFANAAAALSVAGRGAIAGMPTLAQVQKFIDS